MTGILLSMRYLLILALLCTASKAESAEIGVDSRFTISYVTDANIPGFVDPGNNTEFDFPVPGVRAALKLSEDLLIEGALSIHSHRERDLDLFIFSLEPRLLLDVASGYFLVGGFTFDFFQVEKLEQEQFGLIAGLGKRFPVDDRVSIRAQFDAIVKFESRGNPGELLREQFLVRFSVGLSVFI